MKMMGGGNAGGGMPGMEHAFSASLSSTNVFLDMSALQGMLGGAGGAGGMPDM